MQMQLPLLRTDKKRFTDEDILKQIEAYEESHVPEYRKLWRYYRGDNPTISDRTPPEPSSPQNNTPIAYGRKIITTFTGYAYRPRYITYKSDNETYLNLLQVNFDLNNEHIVTSRHGRNTGIFGVSYELLYTEGQDIGGTEQAEPRYIVVDPREMLLFYDYSLDPKKVAAIRFYRITDDSYKVDVYYPEQIFSYDRKRSRETGKWVLTATGQFPNYFGVVPVNPYYLGDERMGIIKPVLPLIDDYDLLMSDSMIEFDRFANSYLRLVGRGLVDPTLAKREGGIFKALRRLKAARAFENLKAADDVTFLTKDIPKDFLEFMRDALREEIHNQSHVPDFKSKEFATGLSGVAVQRLMFDFENLVASAESDFDVGLIGRIRMITDIYRKAGRTVGNPDEITISHKRNTPENVKEFAETAKVMKEAGFSQYLCADIMPDDIIPDVQAELDREEEERNGMIDVEGMPEPDVSAEGALQPQGDVQAQALNGAQIKSLVDIATAVSTKTMPPETAIQILLVSIPSLSEAEARAIINPAAGFEVANVQAQPSVQPDSNSP